MTCGVGLDQTTTIWISLAWLTSRGVGLDPAAFEIRRGVQDNDDMDFLSPARQSWRRLRSDSRSNLSRGRKRRYGFLELYARRCAQENEIKHLLLSA